MRHSRVCLASFTIFAAVLLAACASSTPGGQPDAEPIDPADAAAPPDAGPPDAEPCIPDPDGEQCNGNDDDCDDVTDEGFAGVGEPCDVGVGACSVEGVTQCTTDGSSTECGATPGTPGDELCGSGDDEDCDGATDEGFPNLGQPCSVGTGACFAAGVFVCSGTGLTTTCNATPGDPSPEICNGQDEDCDILVDEGFNLNQSCDDASDTDLCAEGIYACDGAGGVMCTDATGSTFDVCNGGDDDCDPTSADGSEDGQVGVMCDGAGDTDLCLDVLSTCSGGSVVCVDNSASTTDLCGNGNEDCDLASPDGSEHPGYNAICDGGDGDLCNEGNRVCSGTSLVCNDATGTTSDLCGNGDEDCDPASADGTEHAGFGAACDGGADSDLCVEGSNVCSGTSLVCNDATASTFEACNGDAVDEDCEGGVDEGFNLNDNPACGTPFFVGTISGDNSSPVLTDSWFDEEWDRVRLTEDDDGIVYLSGHFVLYSPPGVDFDLYLYCNGCPGSVIQSSTVHSLAGHYDIVDIRNDDDWGSDDDIDAIVEIRNYNSNRCAYWTLTVTGDLAAPSNNCDP